MPVPQHIKLLIIEDDSGDMEFVCDILSQPDSVTIDTERADRLSSALRFLAQKQFDVVLLDLGLPDSQGLATFTEIYSRHPQVPVIVLSGFDDEERALQAVQNGAQDYLIKGLVDGNLLVRTIRHSIERQKLKEQVESSLREIKTLKGLLPICASCKKIRNDEGYWEQIEIYVGNRSDAEFSHGICPDCAVKIYPQYYKKDE